MVTAYSIQISKYLKNMTAQQHLEGLAGHVFESSLWAAIILTLSEQLFSNKRSSFHQHTWELVGLL